MSNPLNLFLKDPDAMRYELMRAQAEGMAGGGVVQPNAPAAVMSSDEFFRAAEAEGLPTDLASLNRLVELVNRGMSLKQAAAALAPKKFAGGGKVYGSEVPSAQAAPPVEQMREALAERSWLDTLAGVGETGLGFLTGAAAQPAAGIAGAVGETLGLGRGEDIAGRVADALTYAPSTAAGQQMSQDLIDLMVKSGVASLPPVVSGVNPAALRVNPGAARYAGAQAVEAARPLHEAYMAGEVPGAVNPAVSVVKNKGGNWLPGSVEKNLEPLKRTTDTEIAALQGFDPPDQHISSWVDSKLTKYIKNEMGTPEDPIRALADKGKLHINSEELPYIMVDENTDVRPTGWVAENRVLSGFPPESVSKTLAGRNWEASSDVGIKPLNIENIHKSLKEPWMENLPSGSKIYSTQPESFNKLGFTHLVDELRNATGGDKTLPQQLRIDPAKLERMSVPEVVNRVADINKWRFEQAGKVAVENIAKLPEAFPSTDPKFTWRNLNNPEDAALSKGAHEAVGKDMGICIGGADYVGRAAKGEADHFTLFDDKGHPHIAIETRPGKEINTYGVSSAAEQEAVFQDALKSIGATEMTAKNEPAVNAEMSRLIQERFYGGRESSNIIQVKGKANETKVNPKYQEQLKEFLNSRQWGDVQETGGLIDTSKEIEFGQKILELLPNISNPYKAAESLKAKLPRFISSDDLKTALYPEGYARGGAVKPRPIAFKENTSYNTDDMRYELARRKG